MNSNSAVFGLCNPGAESGYGSSPQHYPTSEQLTAFYGGSGGSGSGPEPDSPSPYGSIHSESRTTNSVPSVPTQPETKYEPNPSHSPTQTAGAGGGGIVSSDNGLQYANLDGDMKGGGYPAGYPAHQSYGSAAHHASLVQASYAHHYGTFGF